jgi:branched-chain amino acid transport system ATP-binding protein
MGIGYMPEDRGLVPELTVEENILIPLWASKMANTGPRLSFVYEVLPELHGMRERRALLLSGGQQKLVALGRALAIGTRLLLLDEVMAGLNPQEIMEIIAIIRKIRDTGVTILLIEHVMHAVMSLSEHIYVLSYGKIIAQGAPREIVNNRDVVEAYLGRGAADQMGAEPAQGVEHA